MSYQPEITTRPVREVAAKLAEWKFSNQVAQNGCIVATPRELNAMLTQEEIENLP